MLYLLQKESSWENSVEEQISMDPPAHTSPALCGIFVGSGSAWPGSRSVPPSCRHQWRPWPLRQRLRLPTRRLSPARPRPPPAACCPVASAGDLEAPPPGRLGYWALWRTRGDNVNIMVPNSLICVFNSSLLRWTKWLNNKAEEFYSVWNAVEFFSCSSPPEWTPWNMAIVLIVQVCAIKTCSLTEACS